MISETTLKYLIAKKVKDANALLKNKRYPATIYMAGYAVEIALKYRICKTFNFMNGFPETSQELTNYLTLNNINQSRPIIIHLKDIRHHDLNRLLLHSGMESRIVNFFPTEWKVVERWNPANRYKKARIIEKIATSYLETVKVLVKEFV